MDDLPALPAQLPASVIPAALLQRPSHRPHMADAGSHQGAVGQDGGRADPGRRDGPKEEDLLGGWERPTTKKKT